jgi:ABC-type transport system involved in Fe-S cluster assembly fused permease/ATPase subunit
MSLSSEFHESRTTGDIHQTISQGKGIRKIVDTVFFSLGPMFIDLFLVFAYLYYLFGPYMALDLAATTLFYLYTTAKLVSLAAARRRIYHTYYRKEWYSSLSSVGNWRVASVSYQQFDSPCILTLVSISTRYPTNIANTIQVSQNFV